MREVQRPTLYLDVDGVLFHKGPEHLTWNLRPLAGEFLLWCHVNFECCWCTGWNAKDIRELANLIYVPCAAMWKNATWDTMKTQGMDFQKDFIWVDDAATPVELEELALFRRQGRLQEILHVAPEPMHHLPWVQTRLEEFRYRWMDREGIK